MKRYLAFFGEFYESLGGAKDLLGAFDTAEEAILAAVLKEEKGRGPFTRVVPEWRYTWAHVWDGKLGLIVWESPGKPRSITIKLGYVTGSSSK